MRKSIMSCIKGIIGFAGLLVSVTAHAQDGAGSQEKTPPYAMPELPAISFLGGQANSIARPVTPRALATELANGIDSTGRVKQGLAVAITPFAFLGGSVNLSEYQGKKNWLKAALYNAQVSVGSVRTATNTAATDLSTGVRLVLYDKSDPMQDATYTDFVRTALAAAMPDQPGGSDAAFAKAKQKVVDERKRWRKEHWSADGLAIAAASGWRLNESKLVPDSPNRWLGWSAWITQAKRLTKYGQIIGQFRYLNQQQIQAADNSIQTNNQVDYGARAIFGSAIVNFSAELTGVSRRKPQPKADATGIEWAAGIEFRASDNIWVSTSLGKKLANDARAAPAIVFAGLRWEINTEASMKTP